MTHEYGDPLNPEAFDAAATKVLALRRFAPDEPLDKLIEQAVHEHICACAVDIEDWIEGSRSGLHDAIAHEVRKRVKHALRDAEEQSRSYDQFDRAPNQSFPARIRPLGSTKD